MLNKIRISTALVLSGLVLSGPATAQQFADDVSDFAVWGNITATGNFGAFNPNNPTLAKVKWWAEGQGRFADDASKFSQAIVRPGVGYQLTETTSIWVGYAWTPTTTPYVKNTYDEHRVWQQVLWSDKFSWGRLTARGRLEERFVPDHIGTASNPGDPSPANSTMAARYRQLIKASIPLSFAPGFSYIIQDEAFVSLNDTDWVPRRGFDQNRFFTGLGYAFTKQITGEVGYMNQYIIRRGANYMGHVLSVNLLMNF
ncbi:DUF2490 domain-containing protein [Nitrosospira sp. Nsp13]|uniref:DUF2490 domain-containing protein n=1 Tax=Nitrosospira sp. Nsp13 TaxID=1855332 RepID=UPI0008904C88|nr:DUF2490 domain-containing protein [Nitrosospira sp. Nsp13]SCY47260.1 Protein of unknown function [Nitrosospira sp. Nsp13]